MTEKPYTIQIDADEMAAWICIHGERSRSLVELQAGLKEAGVVNGIDQFLLQDLSEAHQPGIYYCIAQGTPPEEGLEYFFSRHQARTPRRLPDGRVDFYNLDTIQNAVQQQVLVSKMPPDASQTGMTVTGKSLSPTGADVPLPCPGHNVSLSADGCALIALVNGHPVLSGDVLSVEPTYTVDGDVDFSVGNLTCVGNVVVMGDVKSGFSVKGAQDITVYGAVDQAHLEAGGTVTLYGNVFGHHKSSIVSAASVHGTYIDAATVEARRDVVLTRGARHSQLRAGGSIRVQGDVSHIVGGTVQACERILVHNLGSESQVETRVEILSGMYKANDNRRFLKQIATILQEDRVVIGQQAQAKTWSASGEDLDTILQRCQAAIGCLQDYFVHQRHRLPIVPLQMGTVVVSGTVHPGVIIYIGEASFSITEALTAVMFYQAAGVIHVKSLTADEQVYFP